MSLRMTPAAAYVARRAAISLGILLVVSVLVFLITQALPTDVAQTIVGRGATPEQLDVVRERLGLDRPLVVQYLDWLRALVLAGDPGTSLIAGIPVTELVASQIANSFVLVGLTMLVTIPLSVVLGVVTAARRDSRGDRVVLGFSMAVNAVPEFVIATLLVVVFATNVFDILPAVSLIPPGESPFGHVLDMVLPVATLSLLGVTYLYRLIRASVLDVLDSEYVQMATLKGLTPRRVLYRHALPNAVVPTVQAMAVVTAYALGGVVVVEYVFGFPGMGTALTSAVASRDLPTLQFLVMVIAASFVALNFAADTFATAFSPRSRNGGRP